MYLSFSLCFVKHTWGCREEASDLNVSLSLEALQSHEDAAVSGGMVGEDGDGLRDLSGLFQP